VVPEEDLQETMRVAAEHPGVAEEGVAFVPEGPPGSGSGSGSAEPTPKVLDGEAIALVTLDANADSVRATDTLQDLRVDLDQVNEDIVVGGQTAILLDTRDTVDQDRLKVIPAILLVIFVVLALLLRSLLAPFILIVANVLSFGATMGISALLFNHVFGFPASDPSTLLIGFVFLVALGIDYSIFLMTRVREESIKQGTHPGILKGLSVTGGVITSAGVVLAATFAALSVVPILFLAQIAFIVAFGVLLDTVVVRSLLVPSLSYDIGPAVWWPSRLWHTPDHADKVTAEMLHVGRADGVAVHEDDAPRFAPVDNGDGDRGK
jgi:putative drug exporter of the RND superfamily